MHLEKERKQLGSPSGRRIFGGDGGSRGPLPLISFCTACHNRAHQLKAVFSANLGIVLAEPGVQWVILNYNSRDDLHEFLSRRIAKSGGKIIYLRETSARHWHASVAKNIAHKAADGEIVMNLDCDNFIGDAVQKIRSAPVPISGVLHLWSGDHGDGTYGRIALSKDQFLTAGGYDERFFPMGYQDTDLLRRLEAKGLNVARAGCSGGLALRNTKAESIAFCGIEDMSWEQFRTANQARSAENLAAGRFIANAGVPWGCGRVERFDAAT